MARVFSVSGIELMTTRKTLRRVILGAAVSTASMSNFVDSSVFGFESASKVPSSRIQRVQYQPGQPSGQPNSAVTQELNRMFQESGQPMPSMNPQDLPNAQGQNSAMVRQKPITTQPPAQKNFLQRFLGRVSGQDKKEAQAAVTPPVPPDYRQPSQAQVSSSGSQPAAQVRSGQQQMPGQGAGQGQQGMRPQVSSSQSMPQQGPGGYVARPGVNPGNAAPLRTAQVAPPDAQARSLNQPSRPVPSVPGAEQARVAATVSQPAGQGTQQYVQPGTAPAFMPSSQVTPSGSRSTSSQATRTATPVGIREPIAVPPSDDDFQDPFADSDKEADAADALDLDSLMILPAEVATADAPTSSNSPAESAQSVPATNVTSADAVKVSKDTSSLPDQGENSGGIEEEMNPFTGVRLNETDAELFGPGSTESVSTGTPSSAPMIIPPVELSETFGAPAPPMEDFESDLPAINLPSVEDSETESVSPASRTPLSSASSSAQPQSAAASELPVPSLRGADAERLEQSVEQDRRLRQQRLILSRAGQPGFKGFCPVELRDRRNLADADPQLTATFGLQTYTFSSLQAKAAFEADPSRYAPAAGGNDVVLLVNSGEEQAGMLDYALWYRDRLYLFRSRETMVLFNSDPGRFANQY